MEDSERPPSFFGTKIEFRHGDAGPVFPREKSDRREGGGGVGGNMRSDQIRSGIISFTFFGFFSFCIVDQNFSKKTFFFTIGHPPPSSGFLLERLALARRHPSPRACRPPCPSRPPDTPAGSPPVRWPSQPRSWAWWSSQELPRFSLSPRVLHTSRRKKKRKPQRRRRRR